MTDEKVKTEESKESVFDASLVPVKAIAPDGSIKRIKVRFPTDEEWIARGGRHKTMFRNLGRGNQETVLEEPNEFDAELLKKIIIAEDGAEADSFDMYESFRILEALSRVQVINDEDSEADPLHIRLRVPGAITTHLFRMPTSKEKFQAERLATSRTIRNKEVWSTNYQLGADLYDAICRETAGYAGPVPIIHKIAAVLGMVTAIREDLEGADEPDF